MSCAVLLLLLIVSANILLYDVQESASTLIVHHKRFYQQQSPELAHSRIPSVLIFHIATKCSRQSALFRCWSLQLRLCHHIRINYVVKTCSKQWKSSATTVFNHWTSVLVSVLEVSFSSSSALAIICALKGHQPENMEMAEYVYQHATDRNNPVQDLELIAGPQGSFSGQRVLRSRDADNTMRHYFLGDIVDECCRNACSFNMLRRYCKSPE